jgi:hypothetical protein
MKRYGNLFSSVIDEGNIMLAHQNARKGKTHYRDVKMIDKNPHVFIKQIQTMLKDKSYQVGQYDIFSRQVDSGKIRQIYRLQYYPHRIIHHAILQIIEPIWIRYFIADTYCCIKGRGIHKAAKKIQAVMHRERPEYCLKIDVHKFYPSCDNQILKTAVRKKIKDKDILWLLDEIIDSAPGLPIGNYMSQYLANLYLTPFDWFCKQQLQIKNYYRYCDDIVILSNSKDDLWAWFCAISGYLSKELELSLNKNWQVFPVALRGVDFLGYRFFHGYTLLRKSIAKKALKKSKTLKKKNHATTKDIRSMMSYYGWMIHANSLNLRKAVFSDDVYRIINSAAIKGSIRNPLRGVS